MKGREWKQHWADEKVERQCRPNKLSAKLVESSRTQNSLRRANMALLLLSFVVGAGVIAVNSFKFCLKKSSL